MSRAGSNLDKKATLEQQDAPRPDTPEAALRRGPAQPNTPEAALPRGPAQVPEAVVAAARTLFKPKACSVPAVVPAAFVAASLAASAKPVPVPPPAFVAASANAVEMRRQAIQQAAQALLVSAKQFQEMRAREAVVWAPAGVPPPPPPPPMTPAPPKVPPPGWEQETEWPTEQMRTKRLRRINWHDEWR